VLTAAEVRETRFTTTRIKAGYDPRAVDSLLRRLTAELDRLTHDNLQARSQLSGAPGDPSGAVFPSTNLLPEDLAEAMFRSTRPGYSQAEVDEFFDRAQDALSQLLREHDELQARLQPGTGFR
jgi:DivIVA domain-containing protein